MVKKSFKIILDSNNTSSFSGNQFDARYNIDIKQIVQDYELLHKPHAVSFSFKSIASASATSTITMTKLYSLSLDFGKGSNISQYTLLRNVVGLLNLTNDLTATTISGGITTANILWDTKPKDNGYIYLPNILDINNIRLTVYDHTTPTIFNSANDATINTNSKYVCVLCFQEL